MGSSHAKKHFVSRSVQARIILMAKEEMESKLRERERERARESQLKRSLQQALSLSFRSSSFINYLITLSKHSIRFVVSSNSSSTL